MIEPADTELQPGVEPTHAPSHDGGGYFIAPDSADPWPDSLWEQVEPKAVEAAARRVAERESRSSVEERNTVGNPSGFVVHEADREFLRAVDGPASQQALRWLGKS